MMPQREISDPVLVYMATTGNATYVTTTDCSHYVPNNFTGALGVNQYHREASAVLQKPIGHRRSDLLTTR